MAWGYGLKSAKMGIPNTGVVADMPTSTGKKNMYIYDINDGELIKLRGVDFGNGAKKFAVIANTGNVEKYKAFSTKVSNASGVHDLYLCFSDNMGDTRLDWWQFK